MSRIGKLFTLLMPFTVLTRSNSKWLSINYCVHFNTSYRCNDILGLIGGIHKVVHLIS